MPGMEEAKGEGKEPGDMHESRKTKKSGEKFRPQQDYHRAQKNFQKKRWGGWGGGGGGAKRFSLKGKHAEKKGLKKKHVSLG